MFALATRNGVDAGGWAAHSRQLNLRGLPVGTRHRDPSDHVEFGDRLADFGVDDAGESLENLPLQFGVLWYSLLLKLR